MKKFEPIDHATALSLIEDIKEFNTTNDVMEDEDVTAVLAYVVRLIRSPDVGQLQAPLLVTQLEALSAKFAILSTYYTSIDTGKQNRGKKNMYYTLKEKTKDLADAVKYIAR